MEDRWVSRNREPPCREPAFHVDEDIGQLVALQHNRFRRLAISRTGRILTHIERRVFWRRAFEADHAGNAPGGARINVDDRSSLLVGRSGLWTCRLCTFAARQGQGDYGE